MRLVTISGLPGSGTSTLSRLLSETTGWRYLNAGQVFRDMAAEAGQSLQDYGRRAEHDGDIDRALDDRMIELAAGEPGGCILEGRLTGWMAHRRDVPALKVWVHADIHTRAARVAARDRQDAEAATAAVLQREESERLRYARHHRIDLSDQSIYDLVLDSDHTGAAELAERVRQALPQSGVQR